MRKKRIAEKLNKEAEISSHHILCKSRLNGKNPKDNIAFVRADFHNKYHDLFGNMNPDEIITFLTEFFWNGQWEWTIKAFIEKEARDASAERSNGGN